MVLVTGGHKDFIFVLNSDIYSSVYEIRLNNSLNYVLTLVGGRQASIGSFKPWAIQLALVNFGAPGNKISISESERDIYGGR